MILHSAKWTGAYGKVLSLAVSCWCLSIYSPGKRCKCVQAGGWVGNFFSYTSLSLSNSLIPSILHKKCFSWHQRFTISQRSSVVSFPVWLRSQCGNVKSRIEMPCWLNNRACHVGLGAGDMSKVPLVICSPEPPTRMYPYAQPVCGGHS